MRSIVLLAAVGMVAWLLQGCAGNAPRPVPAPEPASAPVADREPEPVPGANPGAGANEITCKTITATGELDGQLPLGSSCVIDIAGADQIEPNAEGWAMVVRPSKDTFDVGEAVPITVAVMNLSGKSKTLSKPFYKNAFEPTVLLMTEQMLWWQSQGSEIEPIEVERTSYQLWRGGGSFPDTGLKVQVNHGQALVYRYRLNAIHDMHRPGDYEIEYKHRDLKTIVVDEWTDRWGRTHRETRKVPRDFAKASAKVQVVDKAMKRYAKERWGDEADGDGS